MHSLESIRVINDRKAINGSQQIFDTETGQLLRAGTNEISTSRVFMNAKQAKEFCAQNGAELLASI